MMQNDYTAPFQLGPPNSFAFASKLPEPFNHVFFTNSGSEAIDTALKMVMAYHCARGESQRIRFVSRERAYHGVNIGGVSLAGMVRNRETFPVVMPNIVMMRHWSTPFAADKFGVMPDIITMAKALTNGAIPMGAVAATDDVYETITDAAPENAIEFFHGYIYSAHPAACAAGLATLQIYEDEELFERSASLSEYFLDAMWSLKDLPVVRDLRGMGTMAGIEVHPIEGKPGICGNDMQKKLF